MVSSRAGGVNGVCRDCVGGGLPVQSFPMGIRIIQAGEGLHDARVAALRGRLRDGGLVGGGQGADVPAAVREILADVRARGDAALIDWQRRLDKAALTPAT